MSPYRTQSPDTSPEMERLLIDRYRGMSPTQKIDMFRGLTQAAQQLALAGLRQRHPGATEQELMIRLVAARLGKETLREVIGRLSQREL